MSTFLHVADLLVFNLFGLEVDKEIHCLSLMINQQDKEDVRKRFSRSFQNKKIN